MSILRILLFFVICCTPSFAWAGPVEDCDKFAGTPEVSIEDIAPEAEAVCLEALDNNDASPKLMHQYARALERAGKTEAALRYYGWASDDGYALARVALDRLGAKVREAHTAVADPLSQYAGEAANIPALMTAFGRDFELLLHGDALHGPETVFAQRRASSPDLARLAKNLILTNDPTAETRFGICMLSKDAASAIVTPILGKTSAAAPSVLQRLEAAAKAAETPLDTRPSIEHLAAMWRETIEEGKVEAAALAANITGIKQAFHAQSAADAAQDFARKPYVLVEWRDSGAWKAFDPSSGTIFDTKGCAPYQTLAKLPAQLTLLLHVKLLVDEVDGSEPPTERILFDQQVPFGSAATFAFAESWGISPPDTQHERGAQEYTPVLLADGKRFYGEAIRLPRSPSTPPEFGEAIADKFGGVVDALGTGDTLAAEAVSIIPDRLRGVRMEITLIDFKGEGEKHTLTLLDRPATATPLTDALGHYLPFMQILALTPLDGVGVPPQPPPSLTISESGLVALVQSAGSAVSGFELLRRAILVDLSAEPGNAPLPRNVGFLATIYEAKAPAAGADVPDLTLRNHMVRPHEPPSSQEANPIIAAADWAVASVLAERLSLTLSLDKDAAAYMPFDAVSVWSGARKVGTFKAISAPEDLASLSDGAKTRAAARLAKGQVLLSPQSTLSPETEGNLAWWAVDAINGLVEDEFANGGRQTLTEYAKIAYDRICKAAPYYAKLGFRAGIVAYGTAAVLAASAGLAGDGLARDGPLKAVVEVVSEIDDNRKKMREGEEAAKAAAPAAAACGK